MKKKINFEIGAGYKSKQYLSQIYFSKDKRFTNSLVKTSQQRNG